MDRTGDPSEWRASNGNRVLGRLPPDGLEIFNGATPAGMTELPGYPATTRVLQPTEPVNVESRYWMVQSSFKAQPASGARWVNEPKSGWGPGWGLGFDDVTERPRIEQAKKAPQRLFHFWAYHQFFVASPDLVELLEQEAPGSFQTLPIDWVFNDGQALDGYVFLDVTKLHHAWDYKRSMVVVETNRGHKHLRFGNRRVMSDDIPTEINIFRDAYSRLEVLVSKQLAGKIMQLASREMSFRDVTNYGTIDFPPSGGRRRFKARLKPAAIPSDDESLPLYRRLEIRVLPLLGEGRFVEADAILTQWLRARAVTPYHVIADLRVTTSLEECAAYLDDFCLRAQAAHPLKTVYLEMNGFTINPDLWFCDAFGFRRPGDDDGDAWLGNFESNADESLVITGLEPLQAVFDAQMSSGPLPDEHKDARTLAVALVIVKVQQLLQAALPLTKHLKCPLWATAHDHYEYLARIVPRVHGTGELT